MEKLDRIPDDKRYYDESDFVKEVIEKINMIIDYLNSQDQEEETRVRIYKDWQTPKGWVDEATKVEVEDTPEETESGVQEWEKKWEEFFLYVINDKNWVDGRPEWKGNVYITLYNAMKDFIRQLLLERERWAEENLLKRLYSAKSKKEFRDMLSKLTTK